MALKFGLLGIGHFGKNHLRLFKEIKGAQLLRAGNSSVIKKIISDPNIDSVVIATPSSTHFKLARQALLAGKNVLVEKPMALNMREAQTLKKIVRQSGNIFMVGHQYLYNDYLKYLKKMLDDGVLGKIYYLFAEHFYLGPIRKDVGCFLETATHELSIIDYLFQPKKIINVQGRQLSFTPSRKDDFTLTDITFNNLSASVAVCWFSPEKIRRFVIAGEKGLITFDDCQKKYKLKIARYPYPHRFKGLSYFFNIKKNKSIVPEVKSHEPLRNQLEHFIFCIKNGKKPLTDIEHGLRITGWLTTIQNRLTKIN